MENKFDCKAPRAVPVRTQTLFAIASALALAAIGCAHAPLHETVQYADAIHGVAAVTEELLTDYTLAVEYIDTRDAASVKPRSDYPIQFDPGLAKPPKEGNPVAKEFRAALSAIEVYNGLLLDLARGDIGANFAEHAAAASTLIETLTSGGTPAALPVAGLAENILTLIAKARNRQQFVHAVDAGRPVIEQLLQGIVDATPDFYRVRVGIVGVAITEIEFRQETVLEELERMAQVYASPSADSTLALRHAQLETAVATLRLAVWPDAVVNPLPTGTQEYDDAAHARLEDQVRVLRGLCDERAVLADSLTRYHAHLSEYVRLLDTTRHYFDALLNAVDSQDNAEVAMRAHDVNVNAQELIESIRRTRSLIALPKSEPANP